MTTINQRKYLYSYFIFVLISITSVSAHEQLTTDTISIYGDIKKIYIPSKISKEPENEIKEEPQTKEANNVLFEKRNQRLVIDNVVSEVNIDIIDKEDSSSLKLTYSYSLLNEDTKLFEDDDIGIGNYIADESKAVRVTFELMKQNLEGQFKEFFNSGKQIIIAISGYSDAIPISNAISYKGEFGKNITEHCYVDGQKRTLSVDTSKGITDNISLAFMRSYSVRDYITKNIEVLGKTNNTFIHNAFLNEQAGGKHRRITIELIVPNAF